MSDSQMAPEAAAQFATAAQHGIGFGLNTSVFGARTIYHLTAAVSSGIILNKNKLSDYWDSERFTF